MATKKAKDIKKGSKTKESKKKDRFAEALDTFAIEVKRNKKLRDSLALLGKG